MNEETVLGPATEFEVVRFRQGKKALQMESVATEVPFTLIANNIEIATLLCTPSHLKELAFGFLFTSGFIANAKEVQSYACDQQKWRADLELARKPDPELMTRRLYTPGCGKGVIYQSMVQMARRHPLATVFQVNDARITELLRWLQTCSALYRTTGAVHTAAISFHGCIPEFAADDIGRHNAVDKVIGRAIMGEMDCSAALLMSTGRTSSEILYKAKMAGIPVTLSRGAPTHQTVLLAREMGITVIGFARGLGFAVYSHAERIQSNEQ